MVVHHLVGGRGPFGAPFHATGTRIACKFPADAGDGLPRRNRMLWDHRGSDGGSEKSPARGPSGASSDEAGNSLLSGNFGSYPGAPVPLPPPRCRERLFVNRAEWTQANARPQMAVGQF